MLRTLSLFALYKLAVLRVKFSLCSSISPKIYQSHINLTPLTRSNSHLHNATQKFHLIYLPKLFTVHVLAMIEIPKTPVPAKDFVSYLNGEQETPVRELLKPFAAYEDALRRCFATEPDHAEISDPFANLVPLFDHGLKIRTSRGDPNGYIMPLKDHERKANGEPAIVDKQDFMTNFAIFSEQALANLDWTNIVAAGSSVLTPLLPLPEDIKTKKEIRRYYHETLAPTSDVDLFIYGVDEAEAYNKLLEVEATIKDNLLWEVTSVRTKNAITIVSRYPNRHIQIVLRLYKSVSEILTGFDVSCSCVAFDGKQVWANPRAIASLITQCSDVDLQRRSPSYEHRLAKYRTRGFEVYFPGLRRGDIDPTIFERSFKRLEGLARLLVLEKLPNSEKRDQYLEERRSERGNPKPSYMKRITLKGDLKADAEVPDWEGEEGDTISSYHTFSIPYGQLHNAKKTEKLLYTKDMLLNAEWNRQSQKGRPYLHRHPCFIGTIEEVSEDCCGFCPEPEDDEEKEVQANDDKIYIRGRLRWLKDNPGRQTIGSFSPIDEGDWTEMAYIGENSKLFSAIVSEDLATVEECLNKDNMDPNRRDCVGRTPLQVACLASSVEVVKALVHGGARLISRMADGRTALHVVAARGAAARENEEICRILLNKSEENEAKQDSEIESEEEKTPKEDAKEKEHDSEEEGNGEEEDDFEEIGSNPDTTAASFITGTDSYMKTKDKTELPTGIPEDEDEVTDVIQIDAPDWNNRFTPLHYAIVAGHIETTRLLVSDFGADVMMPVKLVNDWDGSARAAILSLALVMSLPTSGRTDMTGLLLELGATTAQADLSGNTILSKCITRDFTDVLKVLLEKDKATAGRIINLITPSPNSYYSRGHDTTLLIKALRVNEEAAMILLDNGASPSISLDDWYKSRNRGGSYYSTSDDVLQTFLTEVEQPIIVALQQEAINVVLRLLDAGVDPSTIDTFSQKRVYNTEAYTTPGSLIDLVRKKLTLLDEKIKEIDDKVVKVDEPLKPLDIDEYISEYSPNSYEEWAVRIQVQAENQRREIPKVMNNLAPPGEKTAEERKQKLQDLKALLEKTEKTLVEKGAKTFAELHPDKVFTIDPQGGAAADYERKQRLLQQQQQLQQEQSPKRRWEPAIATGISINRAKSTPEAIGARYIDLLKAVWDCNEEKVKALCFLKPKAKEPETTLVVEQTSTTGRVGFAELPPKAEPKVVETPLLISATDCNGYNPFAIACLRKHPESFKELLLNIAEIQFEPSLKKEREVVYSARFGDEDDESDVSDTDSEPDPDRVRILECLVEEEYTMDILANVAEEVKGTEDAYSTMMELCKIHEDLRDFNKTVYSHQGINPLIRAVYEEDISSAIFLLKMAEKFGRGRTIANLNTYINVANSLGVSYGSDLPGAANIALKLGRIDILREFVRYEGLGLDSQEEQQARKADRPKYYQGINVNGKKRKDWAASANPNHDHEVHDGKDPLLYYAAHQFNILTLDWLHTPEPRNLLKEFGERLAKRDPLDKRVEIIRNASDDKMKRWLGIGSDLLLHISLSSDQNLNEDRKTIAQYWLDRNPQLLETTTHAGILPPIFFSIMKMDVALLEYLLEKGADPRIKDQNGLNILHYLVNNKTTIFSSEAERVEKVDKILDAIPEDVKKFLFTQRGYGNPNGLSQGVLHTPLSYLLASGNTFHYHGSAQNIKDKRPLLSVILKHSGGADLHIRNGYGETPLHTVTKAGDWASVEKLLEIGGPTIAVVEDTNGFTALELAEKRHFSDVVTMFDPSKDGLIMGARSYRKLPILVPYGDDRDRDNHYRVTSVWDIPGATVDKELVQVDHSKVEAALKAATEGKKLERQLAKLHEVAEVSKRLTDPQSKHHYANQRRHFNRYYSRRRLHKRLGDAEEEDETDKPASLFANHLLTLAQ